MDDLIDVCVKYMANDNFTEEELFDYANIDIVFRKMIYDYLKLLLL